MCVLGATESQDLWSGACKGKVDEVRDEGVKLSEMGNSWKILSKGFYIFLFPLTMS